MYCISKFVLMCLIAAGQFSLADEVKTKIDPTKFSSEKVHEQIYSCGKTHLIGPLKTFPYCRGGGFPTCTQLGGSINNAEKETQLSADEVRHTIGFEYYIDYRLRYPYEYHSDYDLVINSFLDKKSPGSLFYSFKESYERKGQDPRVEQASLKMKGSLPLFQFDIKSTENCVYDKWGNKVCKEPTIEYRNIVWNVTNDYLPRSPWINTQTNYELSTFAEVARYQECVESQFQ
ncbi:MAG: hypothetical protein SGJ18_11735 [Pseudomonadota bacterium]|nr:hypothetical protein [Pseudomonadota bacterium]